MMMAIWNICFLKKGTEGSLELPVCRLQKLLRLVCRTTRRQDELVNHDLEMETYTTQTKKNSTWTISEEEKTNANVNTKIEKKKKDTHTHSNKRATEIFC